MKTFKFKGLTLPDGSSGRRGWENSCHIPGIRFLIYVNYRERVSVQETGVHGFKERPGRGRCRTYRALIVPTT